MADIKTTFKGRLNGGDYTLENGQLREDRGLETAIIQSLFTDRRAKPDDQLPHGHSDRRGWFGNRFILERDQVGSRLWLLSREKQTKEVVNRAREYIKESTNWLVEQGIATQVDIHVEIIGQGTLGFRLTVHKPNLNAVEFSYSYLWEDGSYINAV